jgi:hypothetical protein
MYQSASTLHSNISHSWSSGRKNSPIFLTEQHVRTFAEHLPILCEAVCGDEHYSCVDGVFKLVTAGRYRTAKLTLDKQSLYLHLSELRYMLRMFHVVHNQQILYIRALADVMTYAADGLTSTKYVEPATTANKFILSPQLFEELKTIM